MGYITFLYTIAAMLCATSNVLGGGRYDGFIVKRIFPKDRGTLESLMGITEDDHVSFWKGPSRVGHPVDVMVSPEKTEIFDRYLKNLNIKFETFIGDVGERIEQEKSLVKKNSFGWKNYHTLEEIHEWMLKLERQYQEVEVVDAGKSYEGRRILGVHLSRNRNNSNNAVFIESNIHANEWITSAVSTFILNELLNSNDEGVQWLANSYDWYIFPVVNPDGFHYSHTVDRMWRKTRKPYAGNCYGADPNRNWDNHWGEIGSSDDPCSTNFAGSHAFSEECTRSLSNYIASIGDKLVGYIDFHSYSQLLMIPYGWTSQHLDNYNITYPIAKKSAESLKRRYGTEYTVGEIYETIYPASGNSLDWVKTEFQTPLAFVYELRDKGKYGFILPPDQIIPTAQETLDSLVTMFQEYEKVRWRI